jgi:hypothetical protein
METRKYGRYSFADSIGAAKLKKKLDGVQKVNGIFIRKKKISEK